MDENSSFCGEFKEEIIEEFKTEPYDTLFQNDNSGDVFEMHNEYNIENNNQQSILEVVKEENIEIKQEPDEFPYQTNQTVIKDEINSFINNQNSNLGISKRLTNDECRSLLYEVPEDSEDEMEIGNQEEFDEIFEDFDCAMDDSTTDISELSEVDYDIFFEEPNQDNKFVEASEPNTDIDDDSDSTLAHIDEPVNITVNNKRKNNLNVIQNLVWEKKKFEINPEETSFKGSSNLPDNFLNLKSPYMYFIYFFTDDLQKHICDEMLKYSIQKNINKPFKITEIDLKRYIGVLVMMSVQHNPNVRQYWSENLGNKVIKKSMTLNTFEKIRQLLHFNDNNNLVPSNLPGHDRLYRLKPVVETLKKRFESVPLEESLSIYEQLCAIKAKHFHRKCIPMKSHKWGYKLFIMSGVSGFAYTFEIYSGQENHIDLRLSNEPDLGSSANVVVRLSRIIPQNQNFKLYFDDYYTSLPLMVYLKTKGVLSLGTVRRNRLKNVKLPNKNDMMKKKRGFSAECMTSIQGTKISAVTWKDNKLITLISTFVGENPKQDIKRYSKQLKQVITVPSPSVVKVYNKHVGSVDALDVNNRRYKIRMKSNKWYIRLFYHLLDVTITNAWLLYKRVEIQKGNKPHMSLATFREELGVALCSTGSQTTPQSERPLVMISNVTDRKRDYKRYNESANRGERFDGIGHFPAWGNSRQRCRLKGCSKITSVKCRKCDLHMCFTKNNECFFKYHTDM